MSSVHAERVPDDAPRVLVADDQPHVLVALRLLFKREGCRIETAAGPAGVLAALTAREFDVVLIDLNYTSDTTSGTEGLELLSRLRAREGTPPVVVLTGWGTVELAVEAMRRGASDFVLKPWDNGALARTIRDRAREHRDGALERAERAREARRTALDLGVAGRLQRRLLERHSASTTTLDCVADCVQAGLVGGDYIDFLDPGAPGLLGLALGDVSGKGFSGALLMATLRASLRSQCGLLATDLTRLLSPVNRLLLDSTTDERYASLFLGCYDDATRELRYVNCGQLPPWLWRADGRLERLRASAPPLGLFANWCGRETRVRLAPGDLLVLATDGVVEAASDDGEDFGEARLLERLRFHAERCWAGAPTAVLAEVAAHRGREGEDDMTLLVARVR